MIFLRWVQTIQQPRNSSFTICSINQALLHPFQNLGLSLGWPVLHLEHIAGAELWDMSVSIVCRPGITCLSSNSNVVDDCGFGHVGCFQVYGCFKEENRRKLKRSDRVDPKYSRNRAKILGKRYFLKPIKAGSLQNKKNRW